MGRLIDENEVIKVVDRHTREDGTLDNDISCILEEVKTAYSVEKVVEEFRQLSFRNDYVGLDGINSRVVGLDDAIDIIRKGGTK